MSAINPSIVIILKNRLRPKLSNSALRMFAERTARAQHIPRDMLSFPYWKTPKAEKEEEEGWGGERGGGHVFRRRMKKQIGTVDDGWCRFAESGRGIRSGSLDSSRVPSRFRADANGACSGEPGYHPMGWTSDWRGPASPKAFLSS